MMFDLPPIVDALLQLGGVGLVIGLVYWALLSPRKEKAPLLVPGWEYDTLRRAKDAELESQRQMYQKALVDAQDTGKANVEHWRTLRDEVKAEAREAKAEAKDLRDLLKELQDATRESVALANEQTRDLAVILELLRVAQRDPAKPGDSRDG